MEFNIASKYELKLSWDSITYETEGLCKVIGAKFTGNALSLANKVESNDSIKLDFYKQYYSVLEGIYVVDFKWGEAINRSGEVLLKDTFFIHNTLIHIAPRFNNSDYILIDTSDHEEVSHMYTFVYKSYVLNEDGQLYNFGK